MDKTPPPLRLKGFLWFTFSGTAMLSAFILPVHIWALLQGKTMNISLIWFKLYFALLFVVGLYHSLYRVKTIVFDLGFTRAYHWVGGLTTILFLAGVAAAAKLLFA